MLATVISKAVLLIVPFIAAHEGVSLTPHKDMFGTPDVCYGDTELEMREYTKEECDEALLVRVINDYEAPLKKCISVWDSLAVGTQAALISIAYNEGVHRICHSQIVVDLVNGNVYKACNDFKVYNKGGRPLRVIKGLDNRRKDEVKICLQF